MKIWIVNPFDNLPLEGNRPQRYWLLARAFVKAGHEVTLWTSDFSHSRKAKRQITHPLQLEFSLIQIETPAYRHNIGFRRILSHRAFAKRWLKQAKKKDPPDALIVSMPPLALGDAALAYCRECGMSRPFFVVDVQDAWPETFERIVPHWALAPLRHTAKKIYCGADAIVGVAERYVHLARAAGAASPAKVFRLAMDRPLFAARSAMRHEPCSSSAIRLVYAGNMGASYDLATVIAGVRSMDDVSLDLAGSGPHEAHLRRLAAGCDRIRFHGYLGDADLCDLLGAADAALIPMFDDSCVGVPGKLADYTVAGLPILNTLHGETERLLCDAGAGFTYSAGDVSSFCAAVEKMRIADREVLRNGVMKLSLAFDADSVYGGYVAWLEEVRGKCV